MTYLRLGEFAEKISIVEYLINYSDKLRKTWIKYFIKLIFYRTRGYRYQSSLQIPKPKNSMLIIRPKELNPRIFHLHCAALQIYAELLNISATILENQFPLIFQNHPLVLNFNKSITTLKRSQLSGAVP